MKGGDGKLAKTKTDVPFEYIIETLMKGSGFSGGKKRIYELYQTLPLKKDRVAALKKEYGIGGSGWPLEGYGLHGYDYDSKGMKLSWRTECGEHEGTISWSSVEKYIGILIANGDYYYPILSTGSDVWNALIA